MNMAARNWIGLAAVVVVGAAFSSMAGCSGSKDEDSATGGTANNGGTGNEGGSSASSGGSSANSSGNSGGATAASGTTERPADVTCEEPVAVPNALLTDFSEVAAGEYAGKNFSWGNKAKTLTGGTFFYDGDGDDSVNVLKAVIADAEVELSGTIGAGSYAGFGFWFGPACNNATGYNGISFSLRGDPGNTQILVQMQSSRNYPIDEANAKGECKGTWSDGCASNSYTIEATLTATAQTIEIPWTDFTGGKPIDPLNAGELLGIQWHFNCGEEGECTPDVFIDDVKFY